MTWLFVLLAAVFGLIIGSFLNVVVWRVPRGESVVRPPSSCPKCGSPVRARDNVPVVSWLLLKGRCRHCGEPISRRYPLVELGTGVLFALVAWHFGASWVLPAFLYLAAVSVALALIDIDVKRLPNSIVLPSYPVAAVLLLAASAITGDWGAMLRAVIGGAALYSLYFLLVLVYPKGMGFGDVKLAGVLGAYLGWLGWGELVAGGFLGFLLGGVVGGGLLATKVVTRKTMIPFGPFMLLGAFIAVFFGGPLTHWYTGLVGL